MYKLEKFKIHGDERGSLIAIEGGKDIPFEIKRVYYIYGTEQNAIRGRHSHRKLQQVLFCVSGSCDFVLDNGRTRDKIHLSNPDEGLFLTGNIWREFTNFSKDCVVMVLASEYYDESDYIRDYEQFKKEVK